MKKIFILPLILLASNSYAQELPSRAITRYTYFPLNGYNESVIPAQIVPSPQTIPLTAIPNGTAAAPSLKFSAGDGFYENAAGQLVVSLQGAGTIMFYQNGANMRSDGVWGFATNTDPTTG